MDFSKVKGLLTSGSERTVTIKKNVFASIILKGTSILVSLALVPITIGYVSSELYGVWLTLSSILTWLSFFDIGLSHGLKNKLTEAIANDDWKRGRELVSTTYMSMAAVFIPLALVAILIIPHIQWPSLLNVDSIYECEIVVTMQVLVAFFCLQMVINVLTSVIAAFQKVALSQSFGVMGNILALGIIAVLRYTAPASLVTLAFVMAGTTLSITFIASLVLYRKRYNKVAPSVVCFNRSLLSDLYSLGLKFFIIQIQFIVIYQSTNILISHVSSPESVTAYNIAYRYLSVAMILFNMFTAPLWPAYTDAFTRKDFEWMQRVRRRMHMILFTCCAGCIGMALLSPIIYKIWIGDRAVVPVQMTWFVAFYVIVYGLTQVNGTIISGSGKMKLSTIVTTIGMIIYIPLALFLSTFFAEYGIIASMIIINIIYAIFFARQSKMLLYNKACGIWYR